MSKTKEKGCSWHSAKKTNRPARPTETAGGARTIWRTGERILSQ